MNFREFEISLHDFQHDVDSRQTGWKASLSFT